MAADIDGNRLVMERELQGTGRHGMDGFIEFIDRYGFFSAQRAGVENGCGGAVNHSLWVLWLARRERARFIQAHPEVEIPEDSLVLVCLLHSVCDCSYPDIQGRKKALSGGPRSEAILRKAAAPLTEQELAVIRSHTFSSVGADAETMPVEMRLVHYLLYQTCRKADGYASGIPYGTEPVNISVPHKKAKCVEVFFEPDDHRTWWNVTGGPLKTDTLEIGIDPEKLIQMAVTHLASVQDIAVLTDDYGSKAILTVYSCNSDECLMCSDRACFDYKNMVFLISRYPQYRASFVVAQRLNGKWGAFSVKRSGQGRVPLVKCDKVLDYEYHSFEEAMANIGNAGRRNFRIKVSDPDFYTEIPLRNIVK